MAHLNIEIKAHCSDLQAIEALLQARHARFVGEDHQIDTYFQVSQGRLKLREGQLENALIHYDRPEEKGLKRSEVTMFSTPGKTAGLKDIFSKIFGIKAIVDKRRKIFFIDNVKFHLDQVEGLGSFLEIEAIDFDGTIGEERLREQCAHYVELFGCRPDDLIAQSYSDMILALQTGNP